MDPTWNLSHIFDRKSAWISPYQGVIRCQPAVPEWAGPARWPFSFATRSETDCVFPALALRSVRIRLTLPHPPVPAIRPSLTGNMVSCGQHCSLRSSCSPCLIRDAPWCRQCRHRRAHSCYSSLTNARKDKFFHRVCWYCSLPYKCTHTCVELYIVRIASHIARVSEDKFKNWNSSINILVQTAHKFVNRCWRIGLGRFHSIVSVHKSLSIFYCFTLKRFQYLI